jgi:hypothetical protein
MACRAYTVRVGQRDSLERRVRAKGSGGVLRRNTPLCPGNEKDGTRSL